MGQHGWYIRNHAHERVSLIKFIQGLRMPRAIFNWVSKGIHDWFCFTSLWLSTKLAPSSPPIRFITRALGLWCFPVFHANCPWSSDWRIKMLTCAPIGCIDYFGMVFQISTENCSIVRLINRATWRTSGQLLFRFCPEWLEQLSLRWDMVPLESTAHYFSSEWSHKEV